MHHTDREAESGRVLELLKEIAGQPFDHENPSYYGRPATLDADTAQLCAWCRDHGSTIYGMSLELQLWWKRHQRADAKREERERAETRLSNIRDHALAKLTPEERSALGLK